MTTATEESAAGVPPTATEESAAAMPALERRYRTLLLAYPRAYRQAHGDELLDVLLESTAGRTNPPPREAVGLLLGGLRARVLHLTGGNTWLNGLHLGVTAIAVVNLATLAPYASAIPVWTALSVVAVLAVLRAWVWVAIPLTAAIGVKAVAIAGGQQVAETTLLPVYPGVLTDRALFFDSSPPAVAAAYGLVIVGLLALAPLRRSLSPRSWWWWAAVPVAAWAGPSWMAEDSQLLLSLSRMVLEFCLLAGAMAAGYITRDLRWALAGALYLGFTSVEFCLLSFPEDGMRLTSQHLAYWALLGLLAAAAALVPFRQRRHCLD